MPLMALGPNACGGPALSPLPRSPFPHVVRWVLVVCSLAGFVARPPRYVVRMFRGAPRLAPLRRRSFSRRVGSSPRPPCPPPVYVSPIWCVCASVCLVRWWCQYAVAFGRGARSGGILGSLCSLRFKCPRSPAPAPSRLAVGLCRPVLRSGCAQWGHLGLAALAPL